MQTCRFDCKSDQLSGFKIARGQVVSKGEQYMAISKELLDIIACPKCKGDIHLNESENGLICEACKLLYEIKEDIPIMLIEEAKPIDT